MDSPQSVVSPLKTSSAFGEPEKHKSNLVAENPSYLLREITHQRKEPAIHNVKDFYGVLEVCINQARDIHNICIYQKQDVYAKFSLTSSPDNTVSTKIVNGGGRNPVFNENLRLDVHKVDSSLRCEIWMLSRVRNYLEDQILGVALIPLSEIFIHDGKLEKEFSLSSTDLFHSPAGFVQLALSYYGASPEVIPIPPPSKSEQNGADSPESDYDKIEFPDPKVVNENDQMVSEYFGTENQICSEVDIGESFSTATINVTSSPHHDSPPTSVSTNGTPASSSEKPRNLKSPSDKHVTSAKGEREDTRDETGDAESNASGGLSNASSAKPVITVNIKPEATVVQQDIVDMYMKSMQQFTESLAQMKLPGDFENQPTGSGGNSNSDEKTPTSNNSGSKVFYGSRAFF